MFKLIWWFSMSIVATIALVIGSGLLSFLLFHTEGTEGTGHTGSPSS